MGYGIESALEQLGDTNLLRDVLAMYVRSPIEAEAGEAGRPLLDELSAHLAEAIAHGELRADVEPDQLARVIFTSIFGLIAAPARADRDRRAELRLLTDVLLRGMGA